MKKKIFHVLNITGSLKTDCNIKIWKILAKFHVKRKSFNLHCLGIYRQEFEKKFLTGKVIILEFAKMVSFMQKKKNFKFGTKIALFGYFWATILKNYFHI